MSSNKDEQSILPMQDEFYVDNGEDKASSRLPNTSLVKNMETDELYKNKNKNKM